MKKLQLNDALLQQAERISREQQRNILGGGYGGGGGGGGNPCYTAVCYDRNNNVLTTVNTYPSVCVVSGENLPCENALTPNGWEVWYTGCC